MSYLAIYDVVEQRVVRPLHDGETVVMVSDTGQTHMEIRIEPLCGLTVYKEKGKITIHPVVSNVVTLT